MHATRPSDGEARTRLVPGLWRAVGLAAALAAALASPQRAMAGEAQAAIAPPPPIAGGASASDDRRAAWDRLVRLGVEADLQGRHDDAEATWAKLEAIDPTDPEVYLRRIETTYWRHWYDESHDLAEQRIRELLDRSKALAKARLKEDRDDRRAQWLLGEALMQEARFEGVRGNYMRAGTMGERGRNALEDLLEVEPDHVPAQYSLGLYYYFSSLMPDLLQYMNWLWFVPKGDRERGLSLLGDVQASDTLYAPSASMVLMTIHTYHAPTDVETAVGLAEGLHARYPDNAILHFELLEVLLQARRHEQLLAEALDLEARLGESEAVAGRAMLARLWRARAAVDLGRVEEARAIAFAIDPSDGQLPEWGRPWLWLIRGQVLDLEGDREGALTSYRRVLEIGTEEFHSRRPLRLASAGLERPFEPGDAVGGPVLGAAD